MSTVVLSNEEIEDYIHEIGIGGKLVEIDDGSGSSVVLFVRHCSLLEKLHSKLEYKKSYAKAIQDGFMTLEDTEKLMKEKGLFSDADDEELESLYKQLEGQEKLFGMITKVPSKKERVKSNIKIINKKIEDLLFKKEQGFEHSAERKAQEAKYLYLTWRCTLDPHIKERYWDTEENFASETDIVLRRNVLVEYIQFGVGLGISTFRAIARSNLWRVRYMTSLKTGVSLFGVPLPEYSVDQLSLAYWSHFYQSVYDMLPSDRPSDDILEDDAALDAYMKSYMEEQRKDAAEARIEKGRDNNSPAWSHGDVLVTRSNPMYEDMEYSDTVESLKNKTSVDLKTTNTESERERKSIRQQRNRLRENLK